MKTKKNRYLILGAFLCALFLVFYNFDIIQADRYLFNDSELKKSLFISLLFISILGPIIEEIAFRLNIQSNNRWITLISIVVASLIIFGSVSFFIAAILFVAYIFSIAFYWKSNKSYALDIQIIVTSVIFSLIHFTGDSHRINDVLSLSSFFSYYFGGGLILSWIKINYNFFISVAFHVVVNSLSMIFLILPSLERESKILDCNDLKMESETNHIFIDDDSRAYYRKDTLILENTNIIYMLDLYLSDEKIKSNYTQANKFIFYDLKIPQFNDTSPQDILDCLEEHELIKKKSSNRVNIKEF
jgi:hypothetical protein